MSLLERYFGKPSDQIIYSDVEHFFEEEKEESDKIEFKAFHNPDESFKEKQNGILRSICAFLNSSGGIIIWGAPIGQFIEGKKEKVFQGNLSPSDNLIEKDSFINKITDSITPAPNKIKFIRLTHELNYLYLFEVEESEYSPHQFRNIYYMRIDGQTRPAPHHYIEALFKKITFPKLKGFIQLEELSNDGNNIFLQLTPIILNLSKLQNEHNLYYRIIVTKGIFRNSIGNDGIDSPYGMEGHEKRVLNALDTLYYNEVYRSSEIIEFNYDTIQAAGGNFRILLYFGGKNSPLLISKYKLQLNFNNLNPLNLNELFTEINENIYSYDHSDSLGQSEEARISILIGR